MIEQNASVIIRRAIETDASELLIVIRSAMALYARQSGIETPLDAELETIEDLKIHINTDTVLVAERDGELVGTVRLVREDNDTAWFTRFAVLPTYQRSGIGQRLFEASEQYLRQMGCRAVYLHTALTNQALVSFYKAKGFVLQDVAYDRGYPRGCFVKQLNGQAQENRQQDGFVSRVENHAGKHPDQKEDLIL